MKPYSPEQMALSACQRALALIESTFPREHGREDVGLAWADLCAAIAALRIRLHADDRFVARCDHAGYWEVFDMRSAYPSYPRTERTNSASAIATAAAWNAQGRMGDLVCVD